jgi:hypothetical protein
MLALAFKHGEWTGDHTERPYTPQTQGIYQDVQRQYKYNRLLILTFYDIQKDNITRYGLESHRLRGIDIHV